MRFNVWDLKFKVKILGLRCIYSFFGVFMFIFMIYGLGSWFTFYGFMFWLFVVYVLGLNYGDFGVGVEGLCFHDFGCKALRINF